jgi:hypothetical protein
MPGTMLAFLLYVALTIVLAYPLSTSPARLRLPSGPDPDLFLWTLAWDTHAFTSQPLSLFDANIYYPQHDTLAYSENLIGSALLAAPVIWLTGNLVLAYNLVSLLACALCGLGAYLLARRVGVGPLGAFLCGMIFAFSPTRFLRISQLHLGPIQWIPFALAWMHAYLDGGERRHLRLAIACFTLQVLSSGHGAVFLAVAMAGLVTYRVALGEPVRLVARVRDAGLVGAVLLLPCVLMFMPYLAVQGDMGLRRGLEGWGVNKISFLASPAHLQVYVLSLLGQSRINELADAFLFPGYLPLLLSVAAISWHVRRRSPAPDLPAGRMWRLAAVGLDAVVIALLAVGVAVALGGPVKWRVGGLLLVSARDAWRPLMLAAVALGMRIALWRRVPFDMFAGLGRLERAVRAWPPVMRDYAARHRRDPAVFYGLLALVSFWLAVGPPYGLWQFVYWMPGLNFIREASRFTMLGLLGLSVTAGIGFERIVGRVGPRRRIVLAGLVAVLLIGEFAAMPLTVGPNDVEVPAADRWLDSRPKPFAIAEVPVPRPTLAGPFERRQTTYMLHSTAHFQKTVHGYSGLRPRLHADLYWELQTFPDERSVARLLSLGVNYVVVHTDLYPEGAWPRVEQRMSRFGAALRLEHVAGAGRVYSLHPIPANAPQ